ncbi:hypothetical protein [Bosea sp. PAMC 26642]|uniref:hypothetical protein n=1 Tax=Bosea sp. (strain PAMC 26642) TaxID=1792307 RepID=UPI0007704620|nr:hypothetical protein [Bosea sp. PAMC 26642]AMJ59406.1 hypothetical protein AXW83_02995 [Bosea sp. PAMC 26642]
MWYAIAIIATSALALWLALTDSAIWALPLVIIIAALARTMVRSATGKAIRPADIEPRHTDVRQDT